MVKISEIPFLLYVLFTIVYSTSGNPDNPYWSAVYFFVNYTIMLLLFKSQKSKIVRISGISLSTAYLVFIVLRYFTSITCERYYTIIIFAICVTTLILLEHRGRDKNKFS